MWVNSDKWALDVDGRQRFRFQQNYRFPLL